MDPSCNCDVILCAGWDSPLGEAGELTGDVLLGFEGPDVRYMIKVFLLVGLNCINVYILD